MAICVWFKRDLRVADHAVLAQAAEDGRAVLPLFIVEPAYWRLPDSSARQWAFVAECLADLRAACAALGAPLIVRVGPAVEVLERLHRDHGLTQLISHEETGNHWTFRRDCAVAGWAAQVGIDWVEVQPAGVQRRLTNRDRWAAHRNRRLAGAQIPVPLGLRPVEGVDPGPIPTAQDLGLEVDPCPGRQPGGRAHGLSLLGGFLTERGQTYRKAMSSPLEGATACSRLSPHLALGTLSGREVHQANLARRAEVAEAGRRDGWAGSLKSFEARLAWRDHFMQKLEDEPPLEWRCLHPAYEGMRPTTPDPARLAAWAAGETGLPFVDACMRSLRATGWLNFRMRAMVCAVASYHLWLPWRASGTVLARLFTDYEPGIHWSQVQMQSGTTGMNTVRIYNPIKQGHDQDPTGTFTRRWVPELAAVPDALLQEPWRWDGAGQVLGRTYPDPVVDVAAAARVAKDRVFAVRRAAGFRQTAQAVIKKHASRKDGHRFVNDRAPRPARSRRRADPAQGELDL